MNAQFSYKLKLYPILILLFIGGAFAFLFYMSQRWNEMIIAAAVFAALELVVIIYFISKRLVLDDDGVAVCIFWKLGVIGARWENMEEASITARRMLGEPSPAQSLEAVFTPGGAMKWLVGRTKLHMLKIVVKNADPMLIDLRALRKASTLPDLIAQKVTFVK
jgi:hypothetical protein